MKKAPKENLKNYIAESKKSPKPYTKVPKKSIAPSREPATCYFATETFVDQEIHEFRKDVEKWSDSFSDTIAMDRKELLSIINEKADAKRMNVHVEALNIKHNEIEARLNATLDLIESMASNIAALEKEIFDRAISVNKKNADQDKTITDLNVSQSHLKRELTDIKEQFIAHVNRGFFARLFNR